MRATQSAGGFIRSLMAMIRENIALRKELDDSKPMGYYNEPVLGGIPYYRKARPSKGRKRMQSMRSKIRKAKFRRMYKAKYGR